MKFLDTCVVQMLADKRDSLRRTYKYRANEIRSSLKKEGGEFAVPMAALGEAIIKIRDKNGIRSEEPLLELHRLLSAEVLKPYYIRNAYDTYQMARDIVRGTDDARDNISPMDALIVASAIAEPMCSTLVTSDKSLISNDTISRISLDYREEKGYAVLNITDLPSIIHRRLCLDRNKREHAELSVPSSSPRPPSAPGTRDMRRSSTHRPPWTPPRPPPARRPHRP